MPTRGATGWNLDDDSQLAFIHVPRTSGSAVTHYYLANMAHLDDFYEISTLEGMLGFIAAKKRYKVICGHFGFDFANKHISNPSFITFFRDPLARLHAEYCFKKTMQSRIEHLKDHPDVKRANDFQFSQWMQTPGLNQVANKQTVMLSCGFESPKYQYLSMADMTALAKRNLSSFLFTGISEAHTESLWLLSYTLGSYPIRNLPLYNQNVWKEQIGEREKAEAVALLQPDIELYRFGKTLFISRYRSMLATLLENYYKPRQHDLASAVERLLKRPDDDIEAKLPAQHHEQVMELLEAHYSRCEEQRRVASRDRFEITFDQAVQGMGWHRREMAADEIGIPQCVRWTGAEATIDLPISPYRHEYRIYFLAYTEPSNHDIFDGLSLFMNDIPVSIREKSPFVLGGFIYEGHFGREVFENNPRPFSRLRFSVNRTVRPSEKNPDSIDHRELGVRIHWIDILPG